MYCFLNKFYLNFFTSFDAFLLPFKNVPINMFEDSLSDLDGKVANVSFLIILLSVCMISPEVSLWRGDLLLIVLKSSLSSDKSFKLLLF